MSFNIEIEKQIHFAHTIVAGISNQVQEIRNSFRFEIPSIAVHMKYTTLRSTINSNSWITTEATALELLLEVVCGWMRWGGGWGGGL